MEHGQDESLGRFSSNNTLTHFQLVSLPAHPLLPFSFLPLPLPGTIFQRVGCFGNPNPSDRVLTLTPESECPEKQQAMNPAVS